MLLIHEQPLPQVVFKGKIMDPYIVKLVTLPEWSDALVTAKIVNARLCNNNDLPAGTIVPETPIENDSAKLDAFQHCAVFNDLKLQLSTRMMPVTLRFSLSLYNPATGCTVTIESPHSNPVIAITNESQWSDDAGKLVLAHAFEGASDISFAKFANTLHMHFLAVCYPYTYMKNNLFTSLYRFNGPLFLAIRFLTASPVSSPSLRKYIFHYLVIGFFDSVNGLLTTCTANPNRLWW